MTVSTHRRAAHWIGGVFVHAHRNPNGTIDVWLDRGAGREHELFVKRPGRHRR